MQVKRARHKEHLWPSEFFVNYEEVSPRRVDVGYAPFFQMPVISDFTTRAVPDFCEAP